MSFIRSPPDNRLRVMLYDAVREQHRWLAVLNYYADIPAIYGLASQMSIRGRHRAIATSLSVMYMCGLDVVVNEDGYALGVFGINDDYHLRYHLVSDDVMQLWRDIMNGRIREVLNNELYGDLPGNLYDFEGVEFDYGDEDEELYG